MKRQLLDQLAARPRFRGAAVDGRGRIREHLAPASPRGEPRGRPEAALQGDRERRRRLSRASPSAACASACCCREIGAANGVEVSQQEMNRLIGQAAAAISAGKDRERFIQLRPAGADGRRPAARPAVRGQGRRLPVLEGRDHRAHRRRAPSSKPISRAKKAMSMARAAATTMAKPSRRSQEAGSEEGRAAPRPRSRRRAPVEGQGCQAEAGQAGEEGRRGRSRPKPRLLPPKAARPRSRPPRRLPPRRSNRIPARKLELPSSSRRRRQGSSSPG